MGGVWLICGGRNYTNHQKMDDVLESLVAARGVPVLVVEGEARGADLMARSWAEARGIAVCPHPAQWSKYGRRAGPVRNREMLTHHPDLSLVVAFYDRPATESRGTADMVKAAKRAKIELREVLLD